MVNITQVEEKLVMMGMRITGMAVQIAPLKLLIYVKMLHWEQVIVIKLVEMEKPISIQLEKFVTMITKFQVMAALQVV